jgi:hypothetical protein
MSWNYRIIFHPPYTVKVGGKDLPQFAFFAIHEVYYDKDGNLEGYAEDPEICGNEITDITNPVEIALSLQSIRDIYDKQIESFKKDILTIEDFNRKG